MLTKSKWEKHLFGQNSDAGERNSPELNFQRKTK